MKGAGGRGAGVPISVQCTRWRALLIQGDRPGADLPGLRAPGCPVLLNIHPSLRRGAMATDPPPPRTRSARLTLVILLLIPLLSLAALWGFAASITLGNLIRDQHYNRTQNAIAPSIIALAQTLAGERALTLISLGT